MKNSNLIQSLKPLAAYPATMAKVIQSDEAEQRKIVMLLNRLQSNGGSIDHLIRYLNLVSF